jgi:hypothetical protein
MYKHSTAALALLAGAVAAAPASAHPATLHVNATIYDVHASNLPQVKALSLL